MTPRIRIADTDSSIEVLPHCDGVKLVCQEGNAEVLTLDERALTLEEVEKLLDYLELKRQCGWI